jgi:hypothetical protein
VAGRLRLRGLLSQDQYDSCEAYGALARRHAALMGYAVNPLRSLDFERTSASTGTDAGNVDEAEAERVRGRFRIAYSAVVAVSIAAAMLTYDLAVDRLGMEQAQADMGELRRGLNALDRMRRRKVPLPDRPAAHP